MAVQNADRPIITFQAAAESITSVVFIKYFRWYGSNVVAGNTIEVTDTAGHLLYRDIAPYDGYCSLVPYNEIAKGIIVSTMTNGQLDVCVDKDNSQLARE